MPLNFLELTLGIILPLTLQNPKLSRKKEIVFYTCNGLLIITQTGIPCFLEQLISNLMADK
jgi:hypothetical protein